MEIKKELIKREIAGDCILVPVGKSTLDSNGLFALNELAAFIWDILPDVTSEEEIVSKVLDEYDVDRETAAGDVAEFMANRLKSNIRQLEGAVLRLKALNHFAGSPITISMAQSVIRDVLTDEQPLPITVEKIISEVSTVYGVSPDDMRSTKRSSQVAIARKVAIYVVREITHMPLAAIGTEFGNRDHSTIVYSVNSLTDSMAKDSNLNNLVNDIIKNIKDKNKV